MQTKVDIMDNGEMASLMVMVRNLIRTVVNMLENGLTVRQLVKVLKLTLTNVFSQEFG